MTTNHVQNKTPVWGNQYSIAIRNVQFFSCSNPNSVLTMWPLERPTGLTWSGLWLWLNVLPYSPLHNLLPPQSLPCPSMVRTSVLWFHRLCTCCLCSSSRYLHVTLLFSFQFSSDSTFLENPSLAMLGGMVVSESQLSIFLPCSMFLYSHFLRYMCFCLVVLCLLTLVNKLFEVVLFIFIFLVALSHGSKRVIGS